MTTTSAHKRLNELEGYLTPKQWAIRLADEGRKYPDAVACTKAMAKLPLDQLLVRRPYFAFVAQARERHPGRKPGDIEAQRRLTGTLWEEFHVLKLLIREVNLAMWRKVEGMGLEAALKFSRLQTLILQDIITAMVRTAGSLAKPRKRQSNRSVETQAVFELLAAFTDGDGYSANCYPAPLVEWLHNLTGLLKDFFAHRAAVELIQNQRFDGHPILFLDLEAKITEATRTIEGVVATANEYLHPRAISIPIETIEKASQGEHAAFVAQEWIDAARLEAIESDEEQWREWQRVRNGEENEE